MKCIIVVPFVLVGLLPTELLSQNSAVLWSAFDMGFGVPASPTTSVKSAVGQSFIGISQQANTRVVSGFLADTLLQGTVVEVNESPTTPLTFALRQNYPNPFNPTTMINYDIAEKAHVSLFVFDILGQRVAELVNEEQSPGTYAQRFDAGRLSSGVYFYRLSTTNFAQTKKLVLLR